MRAQQEPWSIDRLPGRDLSQAIPKEGADPSRAPRQQGADWERIGIRAAGSPAQGAPNHERCESAQVPQTPGAGQCTESSAWRAATHRRR